MRIAVGDDARQKKAALALLEAGAVLIPKTVVPETEWVLRARYGLQPGEIIDFLLYLTESEGVVIEDETAVRLAIDYYARGADFADALHLASSGEARLHTFDRAFCRNAIRKGAAPSVVWVKA